MNKSIYNGTLHFNYQFYYKILKYSKPEIYELLNDIQEKITICIDNNERFNLKKEYEMLLERYEELI